MDTDEDDEVAVWYRTTDASESTAGASTCPRPSSQGALAAEPSPGARATDTGSRAAPEVARPGAAAAGADAPTSEGSPAGRAESAARAAAPDRSAKGKGCGTSSSTGTAGRAKGQSHGPQAGDSRGDMAGDGGLCGSRPSDSGRKECICCVHHLPGLPEAHVVAPRSSTDLPEPRGPECESSPLLAGAKRCARPLMWFYLLIQVYQACTLCVKGCLYS